MSVPAPSGPAVDDLPPVRGVTVAVAGVLAVVAAALFAVGAALTDRWLTGSAGLSTMLVAGVIGMAIPLLLIGRRLGWGWREWGFRRPRQSLWHTVWLVPTAILSSLAVTALVLPLLGVSPAEDAATEAAFQEGSAATIVLVALAAIVIAPLIEEMFFRRLLLDWLRRRIPLGPAVLLCSLAFAAVHILPPAMVYVGLVGLWMAVLRVWSGALWHSVILHAANNALATAGGLTNLGAGRAARACDTGHATLAGGLDYAGTVPDDNHDAAIDDLLAILDLEHLGSAKVNVQPTEISAALDGVPETIAEDITLFRGNSQKMPHGRVFGGQVLAQGVVACGRTITDPERRLHSIHAYFMRPGDDTQPITFSVERMRDGRSFSTRRVHAIQHGKPILSMSASFQDPSPGLDHQDEMPPVPPPLEVASLTDIYGGIDDPRAQHIAWARPIEMRHVEGNLFVVPGHEHVAANHVWMRAAGRLPEDPLIHEAVLAYASDYSLLESVLRRHGLAWSHRGMRVASLDHAMWFHRPARVDDFLLYAQTSPSAQGGRGLAVGRIFAADGTLIATLAQEGMMRVPEDR